MNQPKSTPPKATPDGQHSGPHGGQQDDLRDDPAMQGEGNRTAARRYNEETTDFAQSGRVDEAARSARPANAEEARDLQQAEAEGQSHSRGEDPLLHPDKPAKQGERKSDGNTERR